MRLAALVRGFRLGAAPTTVQRRVTIPSNIGYLARLRQGAKRPNQSDYNAEMEKKRRKKRGVTRLAMPHSETIPTDEPALISSPRSLAPEADGRHAEIAGRTPSSSLHNATDTEAPRPKLPLAEVPRTELGVNEERSDQGDTLSAVAIARRSTRRWQIAFAALTGILIPTIAIFVTFAEPDLRITGRPSVKTGPVAVTEGGVTVAGIMEIPFTNYGMRAGHVDRVEIFMVFPKKIVAQMQYVDRRRIGWRQTKVLRFEFVQTVDSVGKHMFHVSFIENTGREIDWYRFGVEMRKEQ